MRTVFISGATGNLGQSLVKRFLGSGDKVFGTVMPGEKVPEEMDNSNFIAFTIDLNDEAATESVINGIISTEGHIDLAILTAGGFAMGNIVKTSSADLLQQFKLNVETAYHIIRPVFRQMMIKGSGRIFMIGSKPGLDMRNSKGMVAYGLSKSLIFRLAELMNEEAKGKDVVTSVIVPSTIDTAQNRKSMPDADFSKWVKPESIAELIHFHCSDKASALREPVIKVYGGS
jgi:NAD(P)-dependent dehydrogenase (short-subunit alcohol dehydrogenase family)